MMSAAVIQFSSKGFLKRLPKTTWNL